MQLSSEFVCSIFSHSLADPDDALLNSFYGRGSYELEDILEELKHSNSTAALDKIMGTEEHRER